MIEHTPTKAPYVLERSTPEKKWTSYFEEQGHAMWELRHNTGFGVNAELRDADGVFIARCGPSVPHPRP